MQRNDDVPRARLQIRAVLVVYRAERRAAAEGRRTSENGLAALRARSIAILEDVQAALDGAAVVDPKLRRELAAARAELAEEDG